MTNFPLEKKREKKNIDTYLIYIEGHTSLTTLSLNFTLNFQNLQQSIGNLHTLLDNEKNKLPNKFSDLHLHSSISWTIIIVVTIIFILFAILSVTLCIIYYRLKKHENLK